MHDRVRATAVLIAAWAQIAGGPLGTAVAGRSIADVSDRTRSLLTPAGWAFTIWALVFASSVAWAVYQALPRQRERAVHRRTGWLLAAAFAGNAVWEIVFPLVGEALPVVPLVLLVAIVTATAVAFTRLQDLPVHGLARVLPAALTGLLLGWVTVATAADVGSSGVAWGAAPTGPAAQAWAVGAVLAVAAVAAALTLAARVAVGPFVLAVAWGLSAIAAAADPVPVTVAAGAAAAAVALVLVARVLVARTRARPDPRTLLIG
ncbi:hypothetical protein OF117_14305 [Geodermatophilus sp. YIM 151500]|uniref:hypothetical protein n=1 Tax=Geodermatophilus sp. YIM 151500 TaxID=2984531 RepID=UPI0021E4E8F9|nr:hypothetical protein [Geodermatophilus sp. YIM 151500]MCV2490531.1 hypothetical protein [Geodermatophilus sp. YIM 151500]